MGIRPPQVFDGCVPKRNGTPFLLSGFSCLGQHPRDVLEADLRLRLLLPTDGQCGCHCSPEVEDVCREAGVSPILRGRQLPPQNTAPCDGHLSIRRPSPQPCSGKQLEAEQRGRARTQCLPTPYPSTPSLPGGSPARSGEPDIKGKTSI